MVKLKLYGIGNEDNFSYYLFDKKQEIFDILIKLFLLEFDIYWLSHSSNENKRINIEKYTDVHKSYVSEKLRIDFFYGKERIYLTLNCPLNLRMKFNEALFKYVVMPKNKFKIKKK
ncbi:Uncharacterised protein [uncultured archaeon]|nr:Uncharacterised protein [uncultured archaeon]